MYVHNIMYVYHKYKIFSKNISILNQRIFRIEKLENILEIKKTEIDYKAIFLKIPVLAVLIGNL